MKLLIVEDEPKVAAFLNQGLSEQRFETDVVYDGQMGLKMAQRNSYDIILLDIIIPYINGIELCKSIKETHPDVPIIMLTALGTTDDKLTGFDAGADDYLVKPFEFKELLARIRALLKRSTGQMSVGNKIKVADLELDLDKKRALRNEKVIELTAKEFSLLEYLMRHKGRVISRSEIAEHVWEVTFDTGTNVVDVYVNLLRKKVDKDFDTKLIHTKIGSGYILNAE
ncbi:response regulator with CheY-like receiver domain and winged-helix DNA-binding domain [Owenweeksia hongkongensis DSM 17368]|uniref:Response regulator with CheY-like receiver domain and winged-helix DNA-binding domain n=1 Tax=Owenweeksia hongkongensis (strain DSM 17368 / CIP 108786 / JCM 12287 / NRRL B-23963 / UST20020801) TaxID=926562 RepID=G8R3I4_OWEHD|nr:response regulator transcription factor [Owenweeksia hongkongensis]AEV33040.1 response regulator with CheY-like receiver domain and winged-helix DNA-binding domain [Owenweeksia hongkongensis DSM 17368]